MTYDLIIIGGAPAGLTAGIYAARKKINAIILTKQVGGQSLMTDSVENFPGYDKVSGVELMSKMRAQIEKYGVPIKEGVIVESIDKKEGNIFEVKLADSEERMEAKSIIVATGKSQNKIGIPGEKEFANKGVVYCATCDAPLFAGKDVAVVGGGNAALESVIDLQKYANKIYVLVRSNKIRGDALLYEQAQKGGKTEFLFNCEPREIQGSNFMEKVLYYDKTAGQMKELAVNGLFVNVGWVPATGFLNKFVELNDYGEIKVDLRTNETSVEGIFAAGDCTDIKYKQIVIACGEGAKAALSAYEYVVRNAK